jgi:hypothetical protein
MHKKDRNVPVAPVFVLHLQSYAQVYFVLLEENIITFYNSDEKFVK